MDWLQKSKEQYIYYYLYSVFSTKLSLKPGYEQFPVLSLLLPSLNVPCRLDISLVAHVLPNREVQLAMTPSPAHDAVSTANKAQEELEENGQSTSEAQGDERSSPLLASISDLVTR